MAIHVGSFVILSAGGVRPELYVVTALASGEATLTPYGPSIGSDISTVAFIPVGELTELIETLGLDQICDVYPIINGSSQAMMPLYRGVRPVNSFQGVLTPTDLYIAVLDNNVVYALKYDSAAPFPDYKLNSWIAWTDPLDSLFPALFVYIDDVGMYTGTFLLVNVTGSTAPVLQGTTSLGVPVVMDGSQVLTSDYVGLTTNPQPWGFPCADGFTTIDQPGDLVKMVYTPTPPAPGLYDATPGVEWTVLALLQALHEPSRLFLLISDARGLRRAAAPGSVQPINRGVSIVASSSPAYIAGAAGTRSP